MLSPQRWEHGTFKFYSHTQKKAYQHSTKGKRMRSKTVPHYYTSAKYKGLSK